MSDVEAIKILTRVRGCRFTDDCKCNCEECVHNYTNEELGEAISTAIDSLLERSKDGH